MTPPTILAFLRPGTPPAHVGRLGADPDPAAVPKCPLRARPVLPSARQWDCALGFPYRQGAPPDTLKLLEPTVRSKIVSYVSSSKKAKIGRLGYMIPQWRNRQLSNSSHFILTMSTMKTAAPLLLCLTLMILEVAPPMTGAPSVASPLLLRLSQRHLRRMSPLL